MSDEQRDRMDRADRADERADEDVEAHGFNPSPVDSPHAGATEEPPDVEGHQLGGRMDPRPID